MAGPWRLLGNQFDAFKTFDPAERIPDVTLRVSSERQAARLRDRDTIDVAFLAGRRCAVEGTLHGSMIDQATALMNSPQLRAFETSDEPARGAGRLWRYPLRARLPGRAGLIEQGVRCVEVNLAGWDSHTNNHETHAGLVKILDPAFARRRRFAPSRSLLARSCCAAGNSVARRSSIRSTGVIIGRTVLAWQWPAAACAVAE